MKNEDGDLELDPDCDNPPPSSSPSFSGDYKEQRSTPTLTSGPHLLPSLVQQQQHLPSSRVSHIPEETPLLAN